MRPSLRLHACWLGTANKALCGYVMGVSAGCGKQLSSGDVSIWEKPRKPKTQREKKKKQDGEKTGPKNNQQKKKNPRFACGREELQSQPPLLRKKPIYGSDRPPPDVRADTTLTDSKRKHSRKRTLLVVARFRQTLGLIVWALQGNGQTFSLDRVRAIFGYLGRLG